MKRSLLVVALLVASLLAVWLLRTKHDDAAPSPPPAGSSAAPVADRISGSASVTPAPSLPDNGGEARLAEPGSGSDYVVGDVHVRDHRSGSNAPMDVPPNIHAPNTRQLPSTLTQDIAQKVRAVLADCAKDVPKDARGEHPRLEGQIIVSIKDHKLAITKATMQLRDLSNDAAEATKQCVETHTVGLETDASDQDDIDNYSIGVTFAVL
jgi:hypothetical protein